MGPAPISRAQLATRRGLAACRRRVSYSAGGSAVKRWYREGLRVEAERCIRGLYQPVTRRCSSSFDETKPDFAPIYNEIALPGLEPDARLTSAFEADKKIGPHISAAQV